MKTILNIKTNNGKHCMSIDTKKRNNDSGCTIKITCKRQLIYLGIYFGNLLI